MSMYRAGNFAKAVAEYTAAISMDPSSAPAYTNRAAAYLKLEQWQEAVEDCSNAMSLLEDSEDFAGGCQHSAIVIGPFDCLTVF
jgi:tetratricopeptide (TPR) repeat protein